MFTTKKRILASLITGLCFTFLIYYFTLPALSVFSVGFWFYLTFSILAFAWPFLIPAKGAVKVKRKNGQFAGVSFEKGKNGLTVKILAAVCAAPLVFCLLAGFFSSAKLFYAKQYASVITVEQADFAADTISLSGWLLEGLRGVSKTGISFSCSRTEGRSSVAGALPLLMTPSNIP